MTIEITIEKLIYGGEGLAHDGGATIFVPFVLPAERVRAESIERKKKFIRARAEGIVSPAAGRVAPRCPHFGVCGGCHYQHMSYATQLRYKAEILRETLRRVGGIQWAGEIRTHGSPEWRYRNRAQWKVRPAGEGAAKVEIGYFQAGSTALCGATECAILSEPLHAALLALRKTAGAGSLPKELREIEAFAAPRNDPHDARLLLTASFSSFPSRAAEFAERCRSIVPGVKSIVFHDPAHDRMELFGPGFIEYSAGEASYRVGHFSFFQVNDFLAGGLAREVAEGEGGALALDLFAGVGLFSLPLARKFDRVIAVESNPAAARDLEYNAHGHGAIEARTADAERFLVKFREKPDLIVVDPPRSGLAPRILERLAHIAPARITYASCEPPTLARDLRKLVPAGYEIAEVQLFDLFPQTFHMETLVRLRRQS